MRGNYEGRIVVLEVRRDGEIREGSGGWGNIDKIPHEYSLDLNTNTHITWHEEEGATW